MHSSLRSVAAVAGVVSLAATVAAVVPAAQVASGAPSAPNLVRHSAQAGAPHRYASPGLGASAGAYGWESTNWSGYATVSSRIASVSGTWTVPAVVASSAPEYSATWVGVDGFGNTDLIQTGTGQDTANGKTSYYAWWEILPAAETPILTMRVVPGNTMTATVKKLSAGTWQIVLKDTTTRASFTKTVSYSGPGTSAEWIEEAPMVGSAQSSLADFGAVAFSNATIDGVGAHLTSSASGAMVNMSGTLIAEPSAPNSAGNGFTDSYVAPATVTAPGGHGRVAVPQPPHRVP